MPVTLEQLKGYDIVVAIDKSASMGTTDCKGGRSRWAFAQEGTFGLATEAAKFDANGIDVVVFNDRHKIYEGVTPDKVAQVFAENSPSGGTETADMLKFLFDRYNKAKAAGSAKPTIIQVITDGAPSDKEAVKRVIIEQTKKQETDEELSVQFIQFGSDAGATAFLRELDDNLTAKGAKFDIVDAKTYDEVVQFDSLSDLLLAAVDD